MARILIIDDDADLRSALKNALAPRGYDMLEAADGPSGLAILSAEAVDLVLLDAGLPDGGGLDALKKAKQVKRPVPVVMLTGYGRSGSSAGILAAGAAGCLQKPFDNAHLLEVALRFTKGQPASREAGLERKEAEKPSLFSSTTKMEALLVCLALAALLFVVFGR